MASLETLLALALCAIVLLATLGLIRRTSAYSRELQELQERSLGPRRDPRQGLVALPSTAPPELVLLFVLSGLRADCVVSQRAPSLAALGESGLAFSSMGAQTSHALLSRKSLLTGKSPSTLLQEIADTDLVELTAHPHASELLVRTFRQVRGTLARGFEEQGYRTAAFADASWAEPEASLAHGFRHFDASGGGLAETLPRALTWLEASAGQPTFVLLHSDDLAIRGELRTRAAQDPAALEGLVASYELALGQADQRLGDFFEALRTRGLYERALIALVADHGECLGEHGRAGHGGLELEELAVPFLLKPPEEWNLPARRYDAPAALVDLLPTLFALCGLRVDGELDGRSLWPSLLQEVRSRGHLSAEIALAESEPHAWNPSQRAWLRPGRWHVLDDGGVEDARFLALDGPPSERAPIRVAQGEFAPLLQLLLGRRREGREPVAFGAELRTELVRLGYPVVPIAGESKASDLR